ncbi:MAG: hypothetical protein IRZ16_14315 [Myxococcaceae bacterium]|nr:hypothetical protein [Myxococcaceae bacterium]
MSPHRVSLFCAAGLVAVALSACNPNVFPVEVQGETTIPGDPSPIPGLLNAFPGIGSFANIDFNQTQEFQNQGVTKDQVRSVHVDHVQIRILSPETQDFSFLENLQFFASAADQELLVAEKFGIDKLGLKAPNPVLELDVKKDVDLAPFVTAEKMSIIVRGKGRMPPQETRLEATVGVNVEVTIF